MAGDWIKMRVNLPKDPRVIKMADFLANERCFMNWLTDPVRHSCKESAYSHVTRNVTAALCVTGLLVTWGMAREIGDRIDDDLFVENCDFNGIDEVSGIPAFADSMESVGWIRVLENGVIFPKFFKDNESPDDKHKRQNADRQKKFREKQSQNSNVTVTDNRNVIVTHREEKRREDINAKTNKRPQNLDQVVSAGFKSGVSKEECESFWHHFESTGWIDKNGHEVQNWQSKLMSWKNFKNNEKGGNHGNYGKNSVTHSATTEEQHAKGF